MNEPGSPSQQLPTPNPAITSNKTSTSCGPSPTQTEHLGAIISLSSPRCLSLLPSVIPPSPVPFLSCQSITRLSGQANQFTKFQVLNLIP